MTASTSRALEASGSVLIVAATVMTSLGMPLMFLPFMMANVCWMFFSLAHGFRYMFALNLLLFLINLFGAVKAWA